MKNSNSFRNRLFRALLCWPLASSALALDPGRALSQYVHDRWSEEQGFPRGAVYAIAQTTDGYLWIGCEAGLVRFDGVNFRLVQDSSASFVIGAVLGLAGDREGNLWLRLPGSTLLRYRDGKFEKPPVAVAFPTIITSVTLGSQGRPLIAMMQRGAFIHRATGFELLTAAEELPRSPVLAFAQSGDSALWFGTRDAGIFRVSGSGTKTLNRELPDLKVNCLLPEGTAGMWIGTDNGVARWNGSEVESRSLPSSSGFQALALLKDRDGNLWTATDSRGLLRFNADGAAALNEEGNRSHQAMTALFEDREGSLWFGSAHGLERLRDSAFVTYSTAEGLPSDHSGPVYAGADGKIWFAPSEGGLQWIDGARQGRIVQAGLASDVVYSIAGGEGELWLGRRHGGLTRLRTTHGAIDATTYTHANGLAQDSVYSVYRTSQGTVWAGTLSGGASRWSGGVFTNFTVADGLASNTVASILEGRDGGMWFATPSGLSLFRDGRWKTYTTREGLPSDSVNCLFRDGKGTLWAGTAGGIAYIYGDRFRKPAPLPASLREQIFGMAEDADGNFWIAASNHVLRVNREKLRAGNLAEGDVRAYGLADGLRGLQAVKRHRSVMADGHGRVWFSMDTGLSVVEPSRLKRASAPALAAVQSISSDRKPLDLHVFVKAPASPRRLSIQYSAITLSVPERVHFRYRLDNFDRDWSEPTSLREAVYTNLGPGPYRFRVVASNADGMWNGAESALAFEIERAFWQTWWFRATGVLACALLLAALYRYRVSRLAAQLSVRFEERLAERTRIAQELHDTLLQGFLSASMQLHVAAESLPGEGPAKPALTNVLVRMTGVIDEGRNAVRGLRSSAGGRDLAGGFAQIPRELAIPPQAEFRVIVEGTARALHPIIRDEAYRIGREALVNAFRHSGASRVEVELDYGARRFRVLVRDNGRGMNALVFQRGRGNHWGLPGIRGRAEAIGARLHVWSGGAGTEVELSIPGHIAFTKNGK